MKNLTGARDDIIKAIREARGNLGKAAAALDIPAYRLRGEVRRSDLYAFIAQEAQEQEVARLERLLEEIKAKGQK